MGSQNIYVSVQNYYRLFSGQCTTVNQSLRNKDFCKQGYLIKMVYGMQ